MARPFGFCREQSFPVDQFGTHLASTILAQKINCLFVQFNLVGPPESEARWCPATQVSLVQEDRESRARSAPEPAGAGTIP